MIFTCFIVYLRLLVVHLFPIPFQRNFKLQNLSLHHKPLLLVLLNKIIMSQKEYFTKIKSIYPRAIESNLCPQELIQENWTSISPITALDNQNVMSVLQKGNTYLICCWN